MAREVDRGGTRVSAAVTRLEWVVFCIVWALVFAAALTYCTLRVAA